ncbi:putative YhbY family RNA-binding protein [Inhella inkyongensis]|uniref:Putative YhbY family RNA-binding protein n=1 Tax=Inhella inkyongensis TaxID=392593 RepID=A0A840S6Q8_9BURK|nr:YhbY family RNA-binding protein [Inhella inkyongensis]MBB5204149.1 putative YhbY family RNA-binding protein [Inhella inkyongensis]
MTALILNSAQRRDLRAQAHHLVPVVMIGGDGLTPAVTKEADAALNAHGLIKVRAAIDDRAAREAAYVQLCDALDCAPVQHIGKLFIVWRPIPEKVKTIDENAKPAPRIVKVVKASKNKHQRPQVKKLRVLGNERVTAGGIVKRAKPRQSGKKSG